MSDGARELVEDAGKHVEEDDMLVVGARNTACHDAPYAEPEYLLLECQRCREKTGMPVEEG